MQIMDLILVAGTLVILVAAATPVSGLNRSVLTAVAVGQLTTVGGVTLAYWYDVAAGGTIILMVITAYLVVTVGSRLHHRGITSETSAQNSLRVNSPSSW